MSHHTSNSYDASVIALPVMAGVAVVLGAAKLLADLHAKGAAFEAQGLKPLDARLRALNLSPLRDPIAQLDPTFASRVSQNPLAFDTQLQQLGTRFVETEGRFLYSQFSAALGEIGYRLEPPRRQQSPAERQLLRAARASDGTVIAIELNPSVGRIELDLAGFKGNACLATRQQLDEALRRRGIRLKINTEQRHASVQGGMLIAKAANQLGQSDSTTASARPQQRQRLSTSGH